MDPAPAAFADVPRTPRGHLGLLFYQAALAVARHTAGRAGAAGSGPGAALRDFPFLAGYLDALADRMGGQPWENGGARRLAGEIARWEAEEGEWLPLLALRAEPGLGDDALRVWTLLGLVEEEPGFGTLFAALQAPLAHRRPTLALLRELAASEAGGEDAWPACRALLERGLAEVANPDAPRAEWVPRIPPALWTAARGEAPAEPLPGLRHHPAASLPELAELVLAPDRRERLLQAAALLGAGQADALVVRGGAGCDRWRTAAALVLALGRGVLDVDAAAGAEALRLAGPLCVLTRAVPLFSPQLGPSELFPLPPLAGYGGPVAVVLGPEGAVSGPVRPVTVELEPDPPALRLEHWRRALGPAAAEAERITAAFCISGGHIRRCAPMALAGAQAEGRTGVTVDDVRRASRELNRGILDALATRLEPGGEWDRLVAGSATRAGLEEMEHRCRHREGLAGAVGHAIPGGVTRGVRALFEGPSGTGKTLAARVLAQRLGVDLYRVDLAAVVNKYVGETEKNLARVLGRAEELDVVLLLDEGDALLARRTDVRSANDRYANLETNYLLQRLETYGGIVVVTTNLPAQIDPAFRRRMDVAVRFHLPDAGQRRGLWALHLPPGHRVDDAALGALAARYRLSGGQIRGAALHAAVLALARGGPVEERDLLAGVEVEHRKAGASFTAAAEPETEGSARALADFLGAVR